MSQFQTLKGAVPQYSQYSLPPRSQPPTFPMTDKYLSCFPLNSQSKVKGGGLPCKKDKKHQSFDLIFICLEKECANNLKPICAQCLHEEHSGHEIKLIKEIAEIANNFISQERRKKKISPYWEQLSEQYNQLYSQIESIIGHLQTFQSTLKKQNEEFFSKLNQEKDTFQETVETASQRILQEKYTTEDELFQKIRLILKSVKIDDPSNPTYRQNILKEETVLLVIENYKEIDTLVSQSKEFIINTMNSYQIKESYSAAEFKITDGEDYLKITSVEPKLNGQSHKQQCIVEFEDDKDDEQKEGEEDDDNYEDFDNDEDDEEYGEDDDNSDNKKNAQKDYKKRILSKNCTIPSAGEKKERKYQQDDNSNNDSDEFDLIEDETSIQKKIESAAAASKLAQELKTKMTVQARAPQLPKIRQHIPEKPSTQEIRMKYASDFSSQFWNQQQHQQQHQHQIQQSSSSSSSQSQCQQQMTRKKEGLSHFDDIQSNEYQYSSDFFSRYSSNAEDIFKHHDTTTPISNVANSLNQFTSGISRSTRPLPPPNNLSIQSFINQYQKM